LGAPRRRLRQGVSWSQPGTNLVDWIYFFFCNNMNVNILPPGSGYDLVRDLMPINTGPYYARLICNDKDATEFGLLPLMAGCWTARSERSTRRASPSALIQELSWYWQLWTQT
jgi:hypothetical protein